MPTGGQNRAIGAKAQRKSRKPLERLGVRMLCPVHTPWRVKREGGRIVGAEVQQKVEGDWRGILPGGRSVLVEVKFTSKPRLTWSTFDDHQHLYLDRHAAAGGLSLAVWWWVEVDPDGDHCQVLQWPIKPLRRGRGVSPSDTESLCLKHLESLLLL